MLDVARVADGFLSIRAGYRDDRKKADETRNVSKHLLLPIGPCFIIDIDQ